MLNILILILYIMFPYVNTVIVVVFLKDIYIYMYMCVNIKSWTCCIAYFIRHHRRAGSYISSHVFRQLWSWSVGTHFFSMCVCVRERVTVLWKLFFLLCVWERESDSIVEIVVFFYPCLFNCFSQKSLPLDSSPVRAFIVWLQIKAHSTNKCKI